MRPASGSNPLVGQQIVSTSPAAPDPRRIKAITEKILGLPTLPTVVSKMIQIVDNPRTSAATLANLISTDQALTARILKMANSAYYGFSREIFTVNMAIVVMGFNAVKEMGLSLSVFDAFKDLSTVRHFSVTEYWEHSIATGVAAKMIAHKCRHNFAGEAFVAGLLHDVGKIIVNQYLRLQFSEVMEKVGAGESLDRAEFDTYGVGHGEIGSWLIDKWRLPLIISESLKWHHAPWEAQQTSKLFVAIICVADRLVHECHVGSSGRLSLEPVDERVWEIFESEGTPISFDSLEELKGAFLIELDKAEAFTGNIKQQL